MLSGPTQVWINCVYYRTRVTESEFEFRCPSPVVGVVNQYCVAIHALSLVGTLYQTEQGFKAEIILQEYKNGVPSVNKNLRNEQIIEVPLCQNSLFPSYKALIP